MEIVFVQEGQGWDWTARLTGWDSTQLSGEPRKVIEQGSDIFVLTGWPSMCQARKVLGWGECEENQEG